MAKRQLDQFDIQAENEGIAISKHSKAVIHAPQLKSTYKVDGYTFRTGNKHRSLDKKG